MRISCIYKIISKQFPDKVYIGSAVDFIGRKKNHLVPLRCNRHANNKLQHHFNKYGIEDLSFEIVERVYKESDLIHREQYFMDTMCPFFNICKEAGRVTGKKHSQATKDKIRKANTGRVYPPITAETRKKLSDIMLNRPPMSLESREKIRQAKLGKPFPTLTPEQRQKNLDALKGKKRTQEFKDNLSRLKKGVKRDPVHIANSVAAKRIAYLNKTKP